MFNVRRIISSVVFYGGVIVAMALLVSLGQTYGWAKVDEEFRAMEPALARSHFKWINKRARTIDRIRYDDLIMFLRPQWKSAPYDYEFGRVIGRPGDVLKMTRGKIVRRARGDGTLGEPEPLSEPYVRREYQRCKDFSEFIVPRNTLFVMFDDRGRRPQLRSLLVPLHAIYGKVIR